MLFLLFALVRADRFSIALFPDPQYDIYLRRGQTQIAMDWLCNCAHDALNVSAVIGLGDATQYDGPMEWERVLRATSCLREKGIPHPWARGDHDATGYPFSDGPGFVARFDAHTHAWRARDAEVIVLDHEAPREASAWARQRWHASDARVLILATHSGMTATERSLNGEAHMPPRVLAVVEDWEPRRGQLGFVVGGHYSNGWSALIARVHNVVGITLNFQDWGPSVGRKAGDWPLAAAGGALQYWMIDTDGDETEVCARTYSPGMGHHVAFSMSYQWGYRGGKILSGCIPYIPEAFEYCNESADDDAILIAAYLMLIAGAVSIAIALITSAHRKRER